MKSEGAPYATVAYRSDSKGVAWPGWDLGGSRDRPDVPFSGSAFRVPAGTIHKIELNVKSGWSIEYGFSSDHDINFLFIGPRGVAIVTKDRSFGEKDKIKVPSPGVYTMLFDNESSVFASKNVTCEYRIVK